MRAQCIICQELFENDDQVISAISCGHTFHNHCLNQWLENGRTCPSCRVQVDKRKIIERLYFDAPEDNNEVVDDGRLQNEIDRLKLEIRKKEKEKKDVIKDKEKQDDRITELQHAKDRVSQMLKEEQTKVSAHLKTLKYYESQQKAVDLERQEYRKIKQKLVTLQSMEVLLNGAESDAADVISSAGEGSSAVQHLSRQVAFLKREFEKLKLEKRQMKEHYEKIQLNDMSKNKKISDLMKQCQTYQEQLERSEGDLKLSEKEVEILKKKNSKLRDKLKSALSPGTSKESSSFTNLMDESWKMQAFSASTPKLGYPESSQNIDLDMTPDLFASPVKSTQPLSTQTQPQASCDTDLSDRSFGKSQKRSRDSDDIENQKQTKYLKITSAAEKNAQKLKRFKSESAIKDSNSISTLASMNIFKKRELGERSKNQRSVVQKGYDGLGGHTTHINPIGHPFKKPAVKKSSSQSKLTKFSKTPLLPKLDHFIILDD
ncbi:E3 ubiquitin-protein ligase TRAIP-like [Mercenaria mercenaria]|uniref:E3 ubiquitin-protein ligase TRAIP-like n=1 Tax=Mercenaria mercenaria TaxID=6596 RepID=UPI00234F72F1|nr:E3 ubiquitin-protein ligase TRAIP-like [Mercenaria mercenaria]XP_045163294.2 E3 ubiquitin-protein ligase TRAIP-like [Mercenaria mercenaria]